MEKQIIYKTKRQKKLFFNVKTTVFVLFSFFLMQNCGEKNEMDKTKTIKTIKSQMQEQEDCWNTGDLDCFMQHYWKSDSLKFIGKSGVTYGWQKTLDNYKKGYPNKNEMGKLKFDNKTVEFIDKETIFVIGKWHLTRTDSLGDLGGYYSLIWKQKNKNWVIVVDHSS